MERITGPIRFAGSKPKDRVHASADGPLHTASEQSVIQNLHAGETKILEMIARGHSLAEVLDALTRFIESQADGIHCSISFVDAELRIRPVSSPSLPPEYNGKFDGVPIFPYIGPCGMAAYLKQQVISESIEADDRWSDGFRAITRQLGMKACWSTPILDSRGSVIGTFAVYRRRPSSPTPHHLSLIEIATRLAGIAIERQIREERLHLYAEIISRSTEAIRISDHMDRTAEQNAAHREVFGLTDDELKGQTSAKIFGEEQSNRVVAVLNEVDKFNGELVATINGRARLIEVSAFAVKNQSKKTVCHVALSRDVTEKRRAEKALKDSHTALESLVAQRTAALQQAFDEIKKSEAKLRRVIDTIPTLAWSAGPDGSADFLSQRWLDYTGMPAELAQGWGWVRAIHPDDREQLVEHWKSSLGMGRPVEAEARMRRFDGSYRWFLFRANALRDESGSVAKWYGTNIDIEDRKQGEESLRARELSWRQIVDNIPGFVHALDATGELEFVNRETLEYFGKTTEELKDWSRLGIVHPDDLPRVEALTKAIEAGQSCEIEHRCRRADGVYRWFRVRGRPVRNAEDKITAWYLLLTDIDDRKKAEEESRIAEEALNLARSELAHVTRVTTLNTLTASIAHEVNQPLSGIITNANTCLRMLSAEPPNVDGARETARRTIRDGNRAADVITRLRTLYSKKDPEPELMDLNEAAREVMFLSLSELQRNRVLVRYELAENLPAITGDRIQLQQVILNLVKNASDAMSTIDGHPRELLIRTERYDKDRVCLSVKDTGVGFPTPAAEKLFEAFYTTKSDGMGIGLSVSRSIINAHHGRLWAEANRGPGATFSFVIPCAPAGLVSVTRRARSDHATDAA